MIQLKSTLSIVLALLCFPGHSQTITYIGNEGVLIEYKGSKVLIDALFNEYNLKFDAPTENTMTQIMTGSAPYDKVNLVLVTHAHPDHFNAQITVDYLNANQNARMIVTPQALDSMKNFATSLDKISAQIYSNPWKKGWKPINQGDIAVNAAYMLHAGKMNFSVQNQTFMITIGDKKIFHLGDTQMERANFDDLKLEYETFDAVIVPFWYLTNVYGAELVNKYLRSKKVIGVHFPKNPSEQPVDKIKEQFPNAILFTSPGQKTSF